jgi:protein-S-isoprenylcysteine O-methyltransferase Ste14
VVDRVRYAVCVLGIVTLPAGLLFWSVIHPWARSWKKLGPTRTYLIVLPLVIACVALLFRIRGRLVGADLGMNWNLVPIAVALYGVVTWLELQYWKYMNIGTLVGLPEVSGSDHRTTTLLKEGIYRVVRHPRYLSAGIGVVANALVINYVGMYVLILLLFPAGFLMLAFEERELVDRFGEEYRQYQRDVPQIIPRWRRAI